MEKDRGIICQKSKIFYFLFPVIISKENYQFTKFYLFYIGNNFDFNPRSIELKFYINGKTMLRLFNITSQQNRTVSLGTFCKIGDKFSFSKLAQLHRNTQTQIQTQAQTHIHTHTHSHTHTLTHTHSHTHTLTQTLTHTHRHRHTKTQTSQQNQ